MESRVNTNNSEPVEVTNKKKKTWELKVYWLEIFLGIVFLLITVLFFLKRDINWNKPLNSELWAQYGDLIGGLVGSMIAYISIRLLVKTLQEQMRANNDVFEFNKECLKTNLINQFESNFQTVFNIYTNSLANFKSIDGQISGSRYLHSCVAEMETSSAKSMVDNYVKNVPIAKKTFDDFYTNNRYCAATYFSLLYRVMQTIDEAKVSDALKRRYAKIVRCQLSEDELLLLRYDASTINGSKMRSYINRYNLLKHLPLTKLLEFAYWQSKLKPQECNELDTMLITLSKGIKEIFVANDKDIFNCPINSNRYLIVAKKEDNGKSLYIEVVIEKKTTDTFCLSSMSDNDIYTLLQAYIRELLIYGSLESYSTENKLDISKEIVTAKNAKKVTIWVKATSENLLIVSQRQLDNPRFS